MRSMLLLPIVAPAAAAVLILVLADSRIGGFIERVIALAGCGAGAAGASATLFHTIRGGESVGRGFTGDPWRAGLALAGLVVVATAFAAERHGPFRSAMLLASASAAAAAPLAGHAASAGAFMLASTIGFAALAFARGSEEGARATLAYLAADAAAIAGLVLLANDGTRTPPIASGAGAALLLVAAAVRTGAFPAFDALVEDEGPLGGLALGPMRAVGFLLAGWVGLARGNTAAAMMVGGAIVAAWAARRAVREASPGSAQLALGLLVLAALGHGAVSTRQGAVLLAAGVFVGATLLRLERARDAGAPSLGAAPLGAALPGVAVVVSSLFARALVQRWTFAAALPAAIAFGWLAVAGVAGWRVRATRRVSFAWAAAPLAAAAAMAVLPSSALSGIGRPLAPSLGAARALGPIPGSMSNELGIALAIAGAIALLVVRAPAAIPVIEHPSEAPEPEPQLHPLRPLVVLAVVSFGWLVALVWVGISRGFL